MSISLVHNISVQDKSRKLASCVRVDSENNAFKTMNSIFLQMHRVIIDREGRYALCSAEVYMYLEKNVVFIRQLPPKHADIFKTFSY